MVLSNKHKINTNLAYPGANRLEKDHFQSGSLLVSYARHMKGGHVGTPALASLRASMQARLQLIKLIELLRCGVL